MGRVGGGNIELEETHGYKTSRHVPSHKEPRKYLEGGKHCVNVFPRAKKLL
jgi:hypothetical protein